MDEEAKGPLAQGHTAGLHAAVGWIQTWAAASKDSEPTRREGVQALRSVVDWGLDERGRENAETVLTWRIRVCMEGNGFR